MKAEDRMFHVVIGVMCIIAGLIAIDSKSCLQPIPFMAMHGLCSRHQFWQGDLGAHLSGEELMSNKKLYERAEEAIDELYSDQT